MNFDYFFIANGRLIILLSAALLIGLPGSASAQFARTNFETPTSIAETRIAPKSALATFNEHFTKGNYHKALAAIAGSPINVKILDLYFARVRGLHALNYLTDAANYMEKMIAIDPRQWSLWSELISLYLASGDLKKARQTGARMYHNRSRVGEEIPTQIDSQAGAFLYDTLNYSHLKMTPDLTIKPNDNINGGGFDSYYIGNFGPFYPDPPEDGWEISYDLNLNFKAPLPGQRVLRFIFNPYGTLFTGPALTKFTDRYDQYSLRLALKADFLEGPIDRSIELGLTRLFPSSHPEGVDGSNTLNLTGTIKPISSSDRYLEVGAIYRRMFPDIDDDSDSNTPHHDYGGYLYFVNWWRPELASSINVGIWRRDKFGDGYDSSRYTLTPGIKFVVLKMLVTFEPSISYRIYDHRHWYAHQQEWNLTMDLGLKINFTSLKIFNRLSGVSKFTGNALNSIFDLVPTIKLGYRRTFSNVDFSKTDGDIYLNASIERAF